MRKHTDTTWAALQTGRDALGRLQYRCSKIHLWTLDSSGGVTMTACGRDYTDFSPGGELPEAVGEAYAIEFHSVQRCAKCSST
jgi:hypothetical protein